MTDFSGSYIGRARVFTTVSVSDVPGHDLQTIEIGGPHSTSDPYWHDSRVTYFGQTDSVNGTGIQRGYFVNEHADGNRDWGTFEGVVKASVDGIAIEGSWRMTDGSGPFKGVRGSGTYRGRFISPIDVECEWSGSYQLASAQAA